MAAHFNPSSETLNDRTFQRNVQVKRNVQAYFISTFIISGLVSSFFGIVISRTPFL